MTTIDRLRSTIAGPEGYGNWVEEMPLLETHSPILNETVESLRTTAGKLNLLDVGCGNGLKFKPAIEILCGSREVEVTYFDIQQSAIEEARKNTPVGISANYLVGDVRFANELKLVYDLINIAEVLHFLSPDDQIKALNNLKSLLKKDGQIYISVCSIFNNVFINRNRNRYENLRRAIEFENGNSTPPLRVFNRKFEKDMYMFTENAIKSLADKAGLEIIGMEPIHNRHFPNGLGPEYPENIAALLRIKPQEI